MTKRAVAAATPSARMQSLIVTFALTCCMAPGARAAGELVVFEIVVDAIATPLTNMSGDAGRGRQIVATRQVGLCLLCHAGPIPEDRFQGNLAPDLRGAGSRWSEGQLRLRMVDARRLNAATIMPSYYRVDGLAQVGPAWQGRPILAAQQIEDVVAYLRTLRSDDLPQQEAK